MVVRYNTKLPEMLSIRCTCSTSLHNYPTLATCNCIPCACPMASKGLAFLASVYCASPSYHLSGHCSQALEGPFFYLEGVWTAVTVVAQNLQSHYHEEQSLQNLSTQSLRLTFRLKYMGIEGKVLDKRLI